MQRRCCRPLAQERLGVFPTWGLVLCKETQPDEQRVDDPFEARLALATSCPRRRQHSLQAHLPAVHACRFCLRMQMHLLARSWMHRPGHLRCRVGWPRPMPCAECLAPFAANLGTLLGHRRRDESRARGSLALGVALRADCRPGSLDYLPSLGTLTTSELQSISVARCNHKSHLICHCASHTPHPSLAHPTSRPLVH